MTVTERMEKERTVYTKEGAILEERERRVLTEQGLWEELSGGSIRKGGSWRSRLDIDDALGVHGCGSGKVIGVPWRSVVQESTVFGVVAGACRELSASAYLVGSGLGRTIHNPDGRNVTGGAEGEAPWEQLEEKTP
ncbi:hypothetical protein F0562_010798 [Nyssa sinensis]|uniref:Uncharacterized protein n=1 Tax=Nyssa sinensis TaxID=561372 RepID=A0A5J4ZZX2_9ASTE|nr:hypothetical protein F0562_010798 [Nyssa sinensis]